MSIERWFRKANAFAFGWKKVHGLTPGLHTVMRGLCVAEHETRCGEAKGWEKGHNWGATTQRVLTLTEKAVLSAANLEPIEANVPKAVEALADAVGKGLIPANPGGELHTDFNPKTKKRYWTWFSASPDDEGGATVFIQFLKGCGPAVHTAMTNPDTGLRDVATALYGASYFMGFHGLDVADRDQKNIDDYTKALMRYSADIVSSLFGKWKAGDTAPSVPPAPLPDDLDTVLGQQRTLNKVYGLCIPALVEDGIRGPKTTRAIRMFQMLRGIEVDGVVGPITKLEMKKATGVIK